MKSQLMYQRISITDVQSHSTMGYRCDGTELSPLKVGTLPLKTSGWNDRDWGLELIIQ